MHTYLWVLGLAPLQRQKGVTKICRVKKHPNVLGNVVPTIHLGLILSSALGQGDL